MKANANERGFTLLEVMIASALTIGVILAVSAAVLPSLHAAANADRKAALADDALNAIADIRSTTVYDDALLQKLVGRSATMTRPLAGAPETLTVSISRPTAGGPIVARASASLEGLTIDEQQTLYQEAPAPGSVVEETQ